MKFKLTVALAALLTTAGMAWAASPADFLRAANTNHDKTLSLVEVQNYALKRFAALDKEHDGKLTKAELGDRISDEDFKSANTHREASTPTLSTTEFSLFVSKLFAAANADLKSGRTDVDGTLSEAELATPAGAKLIRLLD